MAKPIIYTNHRSPSSLSVVVSFNILVGKDWMRLGVLLIMGFLLNCSEISIREIKEGKHLDKAKSSTVDHFLQLRMKNSIKKIIAHNTEIILERPDFIYYGFVKGGNWDNLYVEELFKVSHPELQKFFPGFRNLTGVEIKREIYSSDSFKLKHEHTMLQNMDYIFSLTEKGLEVQVDWKYSVDGKPEEQKRFFILIDSKTGKRISEKQL
ncbi:MAG TPA: hypothetical protein PK079_20855 [Leptospiraceae bacterium]|nr:hypothetical protein [Leptospiraceae bacterium]HNC58872.1 hypothetical protein [Leptospiraceae bacterium]HNE55634.1 hypothetical protein [Leptospiraceae bacterium]HNN80097.1 hypothetical protein [Leptospiraceae bacterium]